MELFLSVNCIFAFKYIILRLSMVKSYSKLFFFFLNFYFINLTFDFYYIFFLKKKSYFIPHRNLFNLRSIIVIFSSRINSLPQKNSMNSLTGYFRMNTKNSQLPEIH